MGSDPWEKAHGKFGEYFGCGGVHPKTLSAYRLKSVAREEMQMAQRSGVDSGPNGGTTPRSDLPGIRTERIPDTSPDLYR
jgi:hypothetical protein